MCMCMCVYARVYLCGFDGEGDVGEPLEVFLEDPLRVVLSDLLPGHGSAESTTAVKLQEGEIKKKEKRRRGRTESSDSVCGVEGYIQQETLEAGGRRKRRIREREREKQSY